MKTLKQILEARIKLGTKKSDGNIEGFFDDYHKTTDEHPFDGHVRLQGLVGTELSSAGDHVHMHDIVNYGEGGQGHGTDALNHIKSLADKHGIEIRGQAKAYSQNPKHITKTKNLVGWYKKQGFTVGKGNVDDGYPISYKGKKPE